MWKLTMNILFHAFAVSLMFIAVYGFVTYSPYKDWSSWHCKCVKQSYFAVLVASSFQWNIPSQFEFRCSFFPECRTILLPMMAEQLESHMSKSEEMSMCADVLTDILDVLWQKEVVSPCFYRFYCLILFIAYNTRWHFSADAHSSTDRHSVCNTDP